jgi:hypothetical protein
MPPRVGQAEVSINSIIQLFFFFLQSLVNPPSYGDRNLVYKSYAFIPTQPTGLSCLFGARWFPPASTVPRSSPRHFTNYYFANVDMISKVLFGHFLFLDSFSLLPGLHTVDVEVGREARDL